MPYVDFKAIKTAVSIGDAATMLKLSLKKSGNHCVAIVPPAETKTNVSSLSRRLADSFSASMLKVGGDCLALCSATHHGT
jgi:hypothetical protein